MPFLWPSCWLSFYRLLFSRSLLSFYGLLLWGWAKGHGWALQTDGVLIALCQPCPTNLFNNNNNFNFNNNNNYYYYYLLLNWVGSARLIENDLHDYTLSVRRPQPQNTNLQTERRGREKQIIEKQNNRQRQIMLNYYTIHILSIFLFFIDLRVH